ncbi:hypothetical protein HNO89_002501 [Sporosarcina luteola]|nr:hypothetical protein [Sporosarcina luteola]
MNDQIVNEMIIPAKEYEQRIPLLLSEHSAGRVHSVFQNGVNVQMGGRLFFIGTKKNGELPFGVHLSSDALPYIVGTVKQDSPVKWEAGPQELVFQAASIAVSLAEAAPFHWEVPFRQLEAQDLTHNLTLLLSILIEEPIATGMEVDIEEFVTAYLEGVQPAGETDRKITELLAALPSSDEKDIEKSLRFFLGRGQGLTPSGDDHLVGILAIHTAVGLLSPEAFRVLRRLVSDEQLTTDVGREYLLYALEGRFSSTVVKVSCALTEKTDNKTVRPLIEELIDMGHSSGVDTVFGMLLGLLIQRRKLEWLKK